MKILFATNNANKLKEVRSKLAGIHEVISLAEVGFEGEIPEDHETLQENAAQKSQYLYERFKMAVFSDDTGLEIEALNGAPGVYSARYAGPACSAQDNMSKVLQELSGEARRSANFRTVISYIDVDGNNHFFEGEVAGQILSERSGAEGFGYDPIFKPNEANVSFAEMSLEDKNKISHRGRAVAKFVEFLR